MNYQDLVPNQLSDESRVWIYQSNRPLRDQEIIEMNEQLQQFYLQWTSHGAQVDGWASVFFDRFIVVMADESNVGVGGCSTDSMVRVIKSFERQYGIELFDRMNIAFLVNDKVEPLPLNQIKYALEKGLLTKKSLLFNNLVAVKKEFLEKWLVPLEESWLMQRIA